MSNDLDNHQATKLRVCTLVVFSVNNVNKVLNIDSNFRHLDLGEREFFGLMFNDSGADHVPVGHSPDVMRWLDPTKLIRKQVRVNGVQKTNVTPVATLYFRVKFYVTDPSRYHSYIT